MQWNLRMVAAQRDLWRCSDLREALLAHGIDISTKKMLRLWSGDPISVRLDVIAALCKVLDCEPNDLMLPDAVVPAPKTATARRTAPVRDAPRVPGGARTFATSGTPRRAMHNRDLVPLTPPPSRPATRVRKTSSS
jgi:putative transcriptional regulator